MQASELTGYPSIDKPWLKYYPQTLLENRVVKNKCKIIERLYEVWKDRTEFIFNYYDENISVEDFFGKINAIARSLKAIGVKENEVLVASLESVPEYIELLMAAELIGCSVKNYLGDVDELICLINSDQTIRFFFAHDYLGRDEVEKIYNNTGINRIVMVNPLFSITEKIKIRDNILEVIKSKYSDQISENIRDISFGDFLKMGENLPDVVPAKGKHVLFSAYTSGTSGTPKEVLHSSESVLGIIDQMSLFPSNEKERDGWLLTILPPTLTAVVIAMMLYPLVDGKRLILDPYCKIEDIDIEMMYYEPQCWPMIPLFFSVLLESKRIPVNYDMSYFKLFGFGAEPMNVRFVEKVQAFLDKHHCKAPFSSGYGQSEGGSDFTIAMGREMIMSGSAGIPLIDTTISIFKTDTCEKLKYYQIGEICKAGPGLMIGYTDTEETKKVLRIHSDGKLWLHTGDIGFITEKGLLFVLGREAIRIFPDKKVFALSIENKISIIDGVKEVIVVSGIDKEHEGFQKPYLFLVGEKDVSQKELLSRVKKFILKEFLEEEWPEKIFVIDKRPIHNFKTDRKLLQIEYGLI